VYAQQTPPATKSKNETTRTPLPIRSLQFSIGEHNNVVRLWASETVVPISVTMSNDVKLTPADVDAYAKSLLVVDKGVVRGPSLSGSVQFDKVPEFVGVTGQAALTWRIRVTASGLVAGTTQVRIAQATLGGSSTPSAFEYSVTSKPAASPQWTLKGAAPAWTVDWGESPEERRLQIVIENQDEPLNNVRIVQSTLQDTAGHVIELTRVKLVDAGTRKEIRSLNVSPNVPQPVLVQVEGPTAFGGFRGSTPRPPRLAADRSHGIPSGATGANQRPAAGACC
jgi:hypothetical protein